MILHTLLDCGFQAQKAASQPFEVFEKGRNDYVTTVDRALDRYLSETFTTHFPADGIVTEENQASAAEFLAQHQRLWLIDPIDGTDDFIHGSGNYSIMVGLLMAGQPRAGWVHAPARQHLCWGGPNWGLFQQYNQGPAHPLIPQEPERARADTMILGDRDQRRFGPAMKARIPDLQFTTVGSFGLKVLAVIQGQAGLYGYFNHRVKLWDTTGPLALARAAGLVCCDLDGQPIRFDATSIYPQTLIHRQPMLIGWPAYINEFRPAIRQAVMAVRSQELALERH